MASSDSLAVLTPANGMPTQSSYARWRTIGDSSTPASNTEVLLFAGATADEHYEWDVLVPANYAGGGFSFTLVYAPTGTLTGAVQFEVRAVKLAAGAGLTSDLGMDTATATDITNTPGGTANVWTVCSPVTVSHANAGSPSPGDTIRVRISRDHDHAAHADDVAFVNCNVLEA